MNYYDVVDIIKSFNSESTEEYIVHEILPIIANTRFSVVLRNYNMSKNIFLQLHEFARKHGYRKEEMLKYSNEHNRKVMLEVFDKLEVFK